MANDVMVPAGAILRDKDRRRDEAIKVELVRSIRLGSSDAQARKCLILGPPGKPCARWSDWKVTKL